MNKENGDLAYRTRPAKVILRRNGRLHFCGSYSHAKWAQCAPANQGGSTAMHTVPAHRRILSLLLPGCVLSSKLNTEWVHGNMTSASLCVLVRLIAVAFCSASWALDLLDKNPGVSVCISEGRGRLPRVLTEHSVCLSVLSDVCSFVFPGLHEILVCPPLKCCCNGDYHCWQ